MIGKLSLALLIIFVISQNHMNLTREEAGDTDTQLSAAASDLFPYPDSISGKYGYMDSQGNIKIQPQYDHAAFFSEHKAVVRVGSMDGNGCGCIDEAGTVIIPLQYRGIYVSNDGMFLYEEYFEDFKLTWIDNSGEIVFEGVYHDIGPFSEGLACVQEREGSKYGFIDITGQYVLPPQYDEFSGFSEGLAFFRGNNLNHGFINKAGEVVIPPVYEATHGFYEGYAAVQKDTWWGFIDKEGKEVIPCEFQYTFGFSDGLAAVQKKGLWGFINKKGDYVVTPQYEYVSSCYNGLFRVMDESWNFLYYANLDGEIIKPKP